MCCAVSREIFGDGDGDGVMHLCVSEERSVCYRAVW